MFSRVDRLFSRARDSFTADSSRPIRLRRMHLGSGLDAARGCCADGRMLAKLDPPGG